MKKVLVTMGMSALLMMVALNVNHAFNHYGILKGSLSLHVLAQSGSSGGTTTDVIRTPLGNGGVSNGTTSNGTTSNGGNGGTSNGGKGDVSDDSKEKKEEDKTKTWQVGDKEIDKIVKTTTEAGFTWESGMNIWLFNGKATSKVPIPSTTHEEAHKVKIKCCRKQGNVTSCSYEDC